MASLLDTLNEAAGPDLSQRLDEAAAPPPPVTPEAASDPTRDVGMENLSRRIRAQHKPDQGPPLEFGLDDAKLILRELALFAIPGAGIAAGGRLALKARPLVEGVMNPKMQAVASRADAALSRARQLREAATKARNTSGGFGLRAEARAASAEADALAVELRGLVGRQYALAGAAKMGGKAAGGFGGGVVATEAINQMSPEERMDHIVNGVAGAFGPLVGPAAEGSARFIARLAAGVPSNAARTNLLAFDRLIRRTRETSKDMRDPSSSATIALGLGTSGVERDIVRDFALRKIAPGSAIQLSDEAGRAIGGTLGTIALPERLGAAATAGALAWFLAPVQTGTALASAAITAALGAYFISPPIRGRITAKLLSDDRFADWLINQVPHARTTRDVVGSLTALYATDKSREVRDTVQGIVGDITQTMNELAEGISRNVPELTDDIRRELERLRYTPTEEQKP